MYNVLSFYFSYTSLMQEGIKRQPTLVIKLRAAFLKVIFLEIVDIMNKW